MKTIKVNGKELKTNLEEISYNDVINFVRKADKSLSELMLTITVSQRGEKSETLIPSGATVRLVTGMTITAVYTI